MGASGSKISTNYTLKESLGENSFFSIHKAIHKTSSQSFTVFVNRNDALNDSTNFQYFQNAVKKLKTIRHPGIVKFIEAQVEPTEIFIVTEPIQPLASLLPLMTSDDVCLGVYDLFKTLDFLHSKKLCHNSLRLDSLFVKENGRKWVIGGLEFLSSFEEIHEDLIKNIQKFMPESWSPPEDLDPQILEQRQLVQSRDYYLLGQVTIDIIARFLSPIYLQTNPSDLNWKELQSYLDQMVSRNPQIRLDPHSILEKPFFKNSVLLNVVDSLTDIRSLSLDLKKRMFSQLPMKLRCITPSTVSKSILPLILKLEFFSEPGSEIIFRELFRVQFEKESKQKLSIIKEEDAVPLVSKEAYQEHILGFIKKAWLSREHETRVMCLRLIHLYLKQLAEWDAAFLPKIVDEILIGLEDTDSDVYLYSILGISAMTPYWIALKQDQIKVSEKSKPNLPSKDSNSITSASSESFIPDPSLIKKISETQGAIKGKGDALLSSLKLVDNILIPHVLKVTVSDEFSMDQKWIVLDELIRLWRILSVLSTNHRTEVAQLCRSIMKSFHVIMRVLEPKYKIEFFCQKLVGGNDILTDPHMMLWIPKVMELGIFFLKDDHKHVRIEIGQAMINTISLISVAMEKAPCVSKKRENQSLKNKLSLAYKSLLRSKQQFPKKGPRQTQSAHASNPSKSPTLESTVMPVITELFKPKTMNQKISIETNWEEDWNEDFDNPMVPNQEENDPLTSRDNSFTVAPNEGLNLSPEIIIPSTNKEIEDDLILDPPKNLVLKDVKPLPKRAILAKTGSTSDIADIGMGQWDAELNTFLEDVS